MYTDFRDLVDGSVLKSDVCIVGAGAAGIAIAHELSGSSLNVLLLESGGFEFDHRIQNLDQIEDVGAVKYPNMATPTSRVRRFGGTTNHWGGMSRPLDPIDFEVRPWVPDSGWPISEQELRPFYERANELCDAGPVKYDATEYWEDPVSARVRFPVSEAVLQTRIYQYAGRKRFGTSYRRSLVSAPNVHVVTGAVVSALETDESGGRVVRAHVKSLRGGSIMVESGQFVLACGAMENARLLLLSNESNPAGLGNDHDMVGRYFGEHPHIYAGTITPQGSSHKAFLYGHFEVEGVTARALFHLSRAFQEKHEVLGVGAALYPWKQRAFRSLKDLMSGLTGRGCQYGIANDVRWIFGDLGGMFSAIADSYRGLTPVVYDPPRFYSFLHPLRLYLKLEQQPNPLSRITLSKKVDELGLPIPKLDWRLTDLDVRSVQVATQAIAEEFRMNGLATVEIEERVLDRDLAWSSIEVYGHHIGTTRMGSNPSSSVVDANCQVHGISNLSIAGSSVFPTAGCVNPTLTILALAARLADRLRNSGGRRERIVLSENGSSQVGKREVRAS